MDYKDIREEVYKEVEGRRLLDLECVYVCERGIAKV